MSIEAPSVARLLFARLCRGENRVLSQNGPDHDAELYRQVEDPDTEAACRIFFAVLGFKLEKGDGCFYFSAEDEPQVNLEAKLEKTIRLVRLLDFLSTHVESFGEGVIFSALTLGARCNGDAKAERFLMEAGKGSNLPERLESLLQSLVRQGYLSEYDPSRKEYRVLSAIHYLFEFADRITLNDESEVEGQNAKT